MWGVVDRIQLTEDSESEDSFLLVMKTAI